MLENCIMTGFADEIDSSIDKQINLLKKLGVSYIEFRSGDGKGVADYTIEEAVSLMKKLKKEGIAISAVGSPIGKIGIQDDFDPHFEKFKHVVELAKIFETKYIRMFSFYIPQDTEPETYYDEVIKRLGQMIAYAKEHHVVLLHENEKGIYGDNAKRCLQLFQALGCENFQCTYDFANFIQCGQDTLEAYEVLKPYITYIHVKDAIWESGKVVPPGEGDGKLAEIFHQFDQAGYHGFLSLEPHLAGFGSFQTLEKSDREFEMTDNEYAWELACKRTMVLLGR